LHTVDIFDGAARTWSTARLSAGRAALAATSLPSQGLALFAGGFTGSYFDRTPGQLCSDVVDIFDGNANTWSTANLIIPRCFLAATSLPIQRLALFAGGEGLFQLLVHTLHLHLSEVQKTNYDIPHPLCATKCYLLLPTQYSRNRAAGDGMHDAVDIFNAYSMSWSFAQLSEKRCFLAATSLPSQGMAFFAGGFNGALKHQCSQVRILNSCT